MTRLLALLVAIICLASSVAASARSADVTILSREPVVVPEDAPEAARKAVDGVVLVRVIYASDGLEVEGFLAQPSGVGTGKLPCVIYNRGGNRVFRAITPARAAVLLARIAGRGYVVVARTTAATENSAPGNIPVSASAPRAIASVAWDARSSATCTATASSSARWLIASLAAATAIPW